LLGAAGVPLINSVDSSRLQLTRVSTQLSGQDFQFEGYLRDPWA
jgi:hypothetical protein